MSAFLPLLLLSSSAQAQPARVPAREIPAEVLVELADVESRFELALLADCDAERCFPSGCVYVDHAVSDQPRSTALPGLADASGPGSARPQAWLTQATCSFAHEPELEAGDVAILVRRLQVRLSGGWTTVSVRNKPLTPCPPTSGTRQLPKARRKRSRSSTPKTRPSPLPEPELTAASAGRQPWAEPLPHAFRMVGLLLTTSPRLGVWALRRVGRVSPEEQLLLQQLASEGAGDDAQVGPAPVAVEPDRTASADPEWVAAQHQRWQRRLEAFDPAHPDPALQALLRQLLRAGEPLWSAMLRFPEHLPAAFPEGGDIASAKLDLADALKRADEATLPDDNAFFSALNRHALAASLTTHKDARVVQALRADFGAAGLAERIASLPARPGALLFALSPPAAQAEVVRLLSPQRVAALAEQLLRSNRLDADETALLFGAVEGRPATAGVGAPSARAVSDEGGPFPAAAALSVLLQRLSTDDRAQLFQAALARTGGTAPAWYRGILVPDMLLALPAEARADVFLAVPVAPLAAAAGPDAGGPGGHAEVDAGVAPALGGRHGPRLPGRRRRRRGSLRPRRGPRGAAGAPRALLRVAPAPTPRRAHVRAPRAIATASLALPLGSCAKVPLYDVAAAFSRADAAWFAEEETLFVFYEVEANQGIGEPSVIEVTWLTDGDAWTGRPSTSWSRCTPTSRWTAG